MARFKNINVLRIKLNSKPNTEKKIRRKEK